MALDDKLFNKAREQFWTDYHGKIEKMGFQLSRDGSILGDEGVSILATIQPHYSRRILRKINRIIPKEYIYQGEKIRVYIFPAMSELSSRFGEI